MNVFADLHHGDLYHSLRMLFEKRLGWNLYRPIGFDWYDKGFWKYSDKIPVVRQYLELRPDYISTPTHYLIYDPVHHEWDKALTFSQFLNTDINIIIASVRQHEEPYTKLIREYKPKAKFIRQLANIHDIFDPQLCKNLLASVEPFNCPKDLNIVYYHQEFDLSIFKYGSPSKELRISNFMNCLPDSRDFPLWNKYKNELKNFDFKMFGILGDDGIIGSVEKIADEMHKSTFVWHVKYGGDGFGHVIHNAFACGRPIITIGSYYRDELAGHLIKDQETCIDLEKRSFEQNIKNIEYWSKPENYIKMSVAAYNIFKKNVDYDKEFIHIKAFLKNLK